MRTVHRVLRLVVRLSIVVTVLAMLSAGGEGAARSAKAMSLQVVPGTWVSSITVFNPATNPTANVQIQFYDAVGNLVSAATQSESVPPGGVMFRYVPNIAGLPSGTFSAVVSSDQQVFATTNLGTAPGTAPVMGESYDGINTVGPVFYVPSVYRNYYGFTSNVVVQNADPSAASVSVQFSGSSPSGPVSYTTPPQTIAPYASYTFDLATMTSLGDGFKGGATINGGGHNVAVVSNTYTPTTSSSMPNYLFASTNGFPPSAAVQAFAPGLYKNYYGFISSLLIQNVDSTPADVQVVYSNGATDGVTGLQPGSAKLFFIPNNPGLPNGWHGSATITSTNGKRIIGTVNIQGTGGLAGVGLASYNTFSNGSTVVYAPGLVKGYHGFDSSLTIQNVDNSPAQITVTYSNGATQSTSLGPGASIQYYLPNVSSLPSGFNGAATITSNGPKIVALVNIQGDRTQDQLFSTNAFGGN